MIARCSRCSWENELLDEGAVCHRCGAKLEVPLAMQTTQGRLVVPSASNGQNMIGTVPEEVDFDEVTTRFEEVTTRFDPDPDLFDDVTKQFVPAREAPHPARPQQVAPAQVDLPVHRSGAPAPYPGIAGAPAPYPGIAGAPAPRTSMPSRHPSAPAPRPSMPSRHPSAPAPHPAAPSRLPSRASNPTQSHNLPQSLPPSRASSPRGGLPSLTDESQAAAAGRAAGSGARAASAVRGESVSRELRGRDQATGASRAGKAPGSSSEGAFVGPDAREPEDGGARTAGGPKPSAAGAENAPSWGFQLVSARVSSLAPQSGTTAACRRCCRRRRWRRRGSPSARAVLARSGFFWFFRTARSRGTRRGGARSCAPPATGAARRTTPGERPLGGTGPCGTDPPRSHHGLARAGASLGSRDGACSRAHHRVHDGPHIAAQGRVCDRARRRSRRGGVRAEACAAGRRRCGLGVALAGGALAAGLFGTIGSADGP